jgi:hypothetical protein
VIDADVIARHSCGRSELALAAEPEELRHPKAFQPRVSRPVSYRL